MSITCDETEAGWLIRIEGEVDVACSGELKRALSTTLSSPKSTQVELGGASDIDITAIQLVWAALGEAQKTGRSLVLAGMPENIQGMIRDVGFHNHFAALVEEAGLESPGATLTESSDE